MTHDELEQQLKHGLEMARDPRNAHICAPDERRVTTIYSPWLLQICAVCRHSFREGDHVLPDPRWPTKTKMVHEDAPAGLFCASRLQGLPPPALAPVAEQHAALRTAFLRGLQANCHNVGDVQTLEVMPRSPLLRRKCPICRHTIRVGDTVVCCPCGNACGGVFHQDTRHNLTCWATWQRGRVLRHCAFTGAAFRSSLT